MATINGTVTDLKVRQDGVLDLATVTLLESQSGVTELLILWVAAPGQPTPFAVWIARSLVVSLLKEALVNKLNVSVTTDGNSANVQYVDLLAA